MATNTTTDQFFELTPERMLNAIEHAISARGTGRCLALNSMENRVYEIELDDSAPSVVAKFYRPGRWSKEAILDEHKFIADLIAEEIPAVAPLTLSNGSTLAESEGIYFAVFPKVRGRILQELNDQQLMQVGRLLARLHNVGSRGKAPHRLAITPDTYLKQPLDFLLASGVIDPQVKPRFEQAARTLLQKIEPLFRNTNVAIRIHGDCHLGNVLWQQDQNRQDAGQCYFLDFDDMLIGPAVQDVWLIVRGRDDDAKRQRDLLLSGYEQMRAFDRQTLNLIEPLRSMRMVHYSAWIARRWQDPTFQRAFPDFTTHKYWFEAANDLSEQLEFID